jgi:glycosyltransferase involved in cell wall biosynthesis
MTNGCMPNGAGSQKAPWFSVVISAYNRSRELRRCLESFADQSFNDYEVIVVDDGSTDDTLSMLAAIEAPAVRLIRHGGNRGLCAARDTGARAALGEWIVTLDSDHGLLPGALENLYARTRNISSEIGVVGSRYVWDTGRVTPAFVPREPIDYVGRLRWVEEEGGTDYLCCYRRSLYGLVSWSAGRRGPLDALFQLELASLTKARIDEDIVAIEYSDAANSETRGTWWGGARTVLGYAADMAWQFEEILRRHGQALAHHAPRSHAYAWRAAALYHLMAGNRGRGAYCARRYLTRSPGSMRGWGILALGIIDKRPLAFVMSARKGLPDISAVLEACARMMSSTPHVRN